MPSYKKKYKSKKRFKKRYNKKTHKYKLVRSLNPVHGVDVRLRKLQTISLMADFHTAMLTFQLDDFRDASVWKNIYTRYRINRIVQTLYPNQINYLAATKQNVGADASTNIVKTQPHIPLLAWRVERTDDSALISSADKAIENPRVKIKQANRIVTMSFKPNVISNVFGELTDNHSAVFDRFLLTSNSSDVDYYGLLRAFIASNASTTYPLSFRVITTAYVSFRGMDTEQS